MIKVIDERIRRFFNSVRMPFRMVIGSTRDVYKSQDGVQALLAVSTVRWRQAAYPFPIGQCVDRSERCDAIEHSAGALLYTVQGVALGPQLAGQRCTLEVVAARRQ